MGNYNCRKGMLQAWQINAAEMMFRGLRDEDIIKELWPEVETRGQIECKRKRLKRLKADETFQAYYKSIVTEWSVHNVGKALTKLSEQIDSDKPWIANKAANDVLMHSRQLTNDQEDNTVVVKFESGIELGSPDQEE